MTDSGTSAAVDRLGLPPLPTVPDVITVGPGSLSGSLTVPGDKSISHRAIIFGALVGEPVAVEGLANSGDVRSTAGAIAAMGADVDLHVDDHGGLSGTVTGPLREPDDVIDCGNSGTGMRLLAGIAAGLDGVTVLTGDASLRGRPMDRVAIPLRAMGVTVDGRDGGRRPPIVVRGGTVSPTRYESPVASAQVKSCVLLAGLAGDGRTTVHSPLPSRDHTERMLGHLGARVGRQLEDDGSEIAWVEPGPLTSRPLRAAGDPSSGAFWWAAAAVAGADAGPVTVRGVSANPTRIGIVAAIEALGGRVTLDLVDDWAGEPIADITVAPAELGSAQLSGRAVVDAIDELPVLAVVGALGGGLEVSDAAELRVKESDRIAAVAAMFEAIGLTIEERPDGYRVPGGQTPSGGVVEARGDHRIAKSAAIAATRATAPIEIRGCHAIATSYPTFLDDLRRLGGHVVGAS